MNARTSFPASSLLSIVRKEKQGMEDSKSKTSIGTVQPRTQPGISSGFLQFDRNVAIYVIHKGIVSFSSFP